MKHELKVDKIELNDEGKVVSAKGRVVKVIDLKDLDTNFLSHRFSKETLNIMFWAQFELDYMN